MTVAGPIDGTRSPDLPGATSTAPSSYRSRVLRHLPLAFVLVVQAAAALRLQNTAFQDEALYINYGHRILDDWLHGVELDAAPEQWFTGAPQLYPVLAALLDSVGGLSLVRLFSALCMLSATAAVYWAANSLFGRPGQVRVGTFAALVFAVSGPVLVLTRFATFDAPSCAAVAWALAVGCWAARRDDARSRWWAALAGGLLALAVVLKYASAIDAPFVLLAIAASTLHEPARRWRGLVTSAVAGLVAAGALAASAVTWAQPLLVGVVATTVDRQSLMPETASQLLARVADVSGPTIALGLLGGLVLLRRRPALGGVLLVASVAAPLYQVYTGESVSLHKTVVLGLVLGAPLAGYLCAAVVGRWWWGFLPTTAALVWSLDYGMSASTQVFTSWPNTSQLVEALSPVVERNPGVRIAGENPEPLEHALRDQSEPWQWTPTYDGTFQYRGRSDLSAFREALSDGYFGLVFLDGASTTGRQLQTEIETYGYEQATVVGTPDGDHEWVVWQADWMTSPN